MFWGIGIAAIGSVWGGCNWGGGDINIDVDKFNNINRNRQIDRGQNKFQHNAANRKGVPYRDQASRDRYNKGVGGAEARNNFRGRDPVTESAPPAGAIDAAKPRHGPGAGARSAAQRSGHA